MIKSHHSLLSTLCSLLIAVAATSTGSAQADSQHHPHFDAEYPDVHDPVMAQGEDGRYYVLSTGMGISVMSSADLKTWRKENSVFAVSGRFPNGKKFSMPGDCPLPQWTTDSVKGFHGHIWAPDISYHNGKWYLYYSCSTFGKNGSAIGVATNKTLDPNSSDFKWEDQGCVIASHRHKDDYNCIDPNLITDKDHNLLFFGSFWDGIQALPLREDLKTPLSHSTTVARRYTPAKNAKTAAPYIEVVNGDTVEAGENAIEAPFVIYHEDNHEPCTMNHEPTGWYYLFVSWDYCCRGKKSTYKTVYGRSRNIEGPFLDKDGRDMALGGGTLLVGPDDQFYGVGHCSAYEIQGQWVFLSHAYDISQKGQSKLYLRKLQFTDDNWIILTK